MGCIRSQVRALSSRPIPFRVAQLDENPFTDSKNQKTACACVAVHKVAGSSPVIPTDIRSKSMPKSRMRSWLNRGENGQKYPLYWLCCTYGESGSEPCILDKKD